MTSPDPGLGGRAGATVAPAEETPPARLPSAPLSQAASLYVVAAYVPRRETITVGAFGAHTFERGWHAYVGSARRGRVARVARHQRREKPLRWHADYLFSRHPASLAWTLSVAPTVLDQPPECLLAGALLSSEPRACRGIPRFGASDCVCAGHLLWFPNRAALRDAVALVAGADVTRVAPLT